MESAMNDSKSHRVNETLRLFGVFAADSFGDVQYRFSSD
jgi:hypothetical protein